MKPPPMKPGPKMMGRPPACPDGARGKMFSLRLLPAERSAVEAAAKRANLSASDWVRRTLAAAAAAAENAADMAETAPAPVAPEPDVAPAPAQLDAGPEPDAPSSPGEDQTGP